MAAYAALVSLSHILHQILHPPPLNKITIDREQIEFLQGKVDFLIDFLETYPSRRSDEIEDLQTRIAEAAYAAEDIIESNVVEQIRATSGENSSTLLYEGIQTVLEKFLSIEKELMMMRDMQGLGDLQPKSSKTATSSRSLPGGKTTMVGFDEHFAAIKEALATDESNRQVIPIVGMGGIGKTTLATAVYNDPFIIEHFHVRAWVTVSQEYTVRELLLRLLFEIYKAGRSKEQSTDDKIELSIDDEIELSTDGEIELKLHQELFDRKYLIVMDDMWDVHACDEVKRFLPRDNNGSRILVTTRQSNLPMDREYCTPNKMDFLDEGQSWVLLRETIFGDENCPIELEEIGKDIANRCSGLPLALVVIGGLLGGSERTREHWESVAGDVISAALNNGNDERLRKILSLSYNHLPLYLKPCFLYLGVFPEDFEICVSTLVRLWVAEGLIKHTQAKCLEEVAHEYLEDLISRNLILVHKRGSSGKVRSCKIHDLIRDLCIIEAEKEKFLYIAKLDNPNISPNIATNRYLSISLPSKPVEVVAIEALQSAKFNRSWLSHGRLSHWWIPEGSGKRPSKEWMVDKIINGFRLLKTLDVCEVITLPAEIWQMPQLRHLITNCQITLPDPPDDQNVIVLENLQTLKRIKNFKCTEQVIKRIPNLKKLETFCDFETSTACEQVGNYCLKNLVCFEKLESLGIDGDEKLRTDIGFPVSLKKLTLIKCWIPWANLSIVGKLPNLEVLKLREGATKGEEWNPTEGEFRQLKYLLIMGSELKIWGAENYHFPKLKHLVLGYLRVLKEIPSSFADSELEEIKLCAVDKSVWTSTREISERREEEGYKPLQVRRIHPVVLLRMPALTEWKMKQKAMKAISGIDGVEFIAADMPANQLRVGGEIDLVAMVMKLRKKGMADRLSVRLAKE